MNSKPGGVDSAKPNVYRPSGPSCCWKSVAPISHSAMRELRVQHQGRPYRVLYIFDPRRVALLLLGGDKTGDDRWYEKNVPLADRICDSYLAEMEEEDNAKDDKVQ